MSLPKYGEDGKIVTSQKSPQEQQLSPKSDEEVIISEKTGLPEVRKKLQEPTAVPQVEPKQQSTTSKKQPLSQPEPKKEEKVFFTRELMHRDAERVRREYKQAHSSHRQEEAIVETMEEFKTEQVQKLPIVQGVDNIRAKVNTLLDQSGANTEGSKKDERVLLMASAVLEMCDLLTTYSESMNKEMVRLNENASHNLNLQEMYVKTVESVTHQVVGNIYHNLKKQEQDAINELMQYVQANSKSMEVDITGCANKVKSATNAATTASQEISASVERFRKVKTFGDFLYYTAPIYVVLDLVLKIVTYFVQR